MSHNGKSTAYIFPLKYCGQYNLGNRSISKSFHQIFEKKRKKKKRKEKHKSFPGKDDRFSRINQMLSLLILPAILQFSKCV